MMSISIGKSRLPLMLTLACSTMALAQAAVAQTSGSTAAAATADAGADAGIADIVVTAQRFSESAQKTPLILSVIAADDLVGITDVRQMQTLNPGVDVTTGGGLNQTFIRGVGQATVVNGQEGAIAYNVDGVYLYTGSMISPLMYDLERIEVLKGPQGTLYGRNASGGAINLITAGARLGATEGYVEGEIGNYDRRRLTGAINLPIGDTLAVRLAGQHVEHDGYLSDGTEDQDMTSGRIRVRWEPSSAVTLLIGGDVSHQGGNAFGSSVSPNPTNDKWIGARDPRLETGPFALFALPPYAPSFLDNDQWSVNAQLDVDLGFATLTVLPAYRREKARYLDYAPGFSDGQRSSTRERTIEARLANRGDVLKWVVGAYYIKADQDNVSTVRQELFNQHVIAAAKYGLESYAFFGEGTFSIAPDFRLTGGLRYTHEKTTLGGTNNSILQPGSSPSYDPFDPVINPTGDLFDFPINGRASASAVSWKVGAEVDLSPSSLLFATASRGFKGGGSYANNPGLQSSFQPEYLTAFELGSRNRFLDDTLQLNGELFYWKLKDQQLNFLGLNGLGLPVLQTVNAGKAHMYGGSVDLVWRFTPEDTFRLAAEYTKSEYDSFTRVIPATSVLSTTVCNITDPGGPNPFRAVTVDCSGQQVIRAPKWALSAGYEHRFDLGSSGNVTFNGDMTYTSGRYLALDYTPLAYQDGYALFNAALSYQTEDEAVTLTGWIRNIGNKRVNSNATQFIDAYSRVVLQPPRTFGVSMRYGF